MSFRDKVTAEYVEVTSNFEGIVVDKLSAAKWKVRVEKVSPLMGDKYPKGKDFDVTSRMLFPALHREKVYVGNTKTGLSILQITPETNASTHAAAIFPVIANAPTSIDDLPSNEKQIAEISKKKGYQFSVQFTENGQKFGEPIYFHTAKEISDFMKYNPEMKQEWLLKL